jgi:DNA-binding CsgD family transcriptional regulator
VRILGRLDERRSLDVILDAARSGLSGALVVRGGPGMGKTSLLDYAVDSAAGFRVSRIAGVQSEMELAYAALHRLLVRFLPLLDGLPPPQRHALGTAFGLVEGPPPDRFMVGLGSLGLLASAAGARPLLCVVDDAQWVDRESLEALAVVGRRLYADRVALLFGAREEEEVDARLDGLDELQLGGLADDVALELIRTVVSGPLDPRAAGRLVKETEGCPLAIIELGAGITAEELSARALIPEPLPLSRRIEAHFLRRISALPVPTQEFLLVAAADPSGDPVVVAGAAEHLRLPEDASGPAMAAGLFELASPTRFRHPLVRSAVYSAASSSDRRRAHAALAAATDATRDPDRRAWHLAAATVGPDEDVAVGLEQAAGRARARGGCSAAGVFLVRAAELTPYRERRAQRVIAAAQSLFAGGAPRRARALLEASDTDISDPLQRATALRLQGAIRYALGEAQAAVSILMEAAQALQPFDAHLSRATLLQALAAARSIGRFAAPGQTEADIAVAARAMPLPAGATPSTADELLDGYVALFLDGYQSAAPLLRRALSTLRADHSASEEILLWVAIGCWVAGSVGDDDALHALARRLVDQAREQGALVQLSNGLLFLAMSELLNGSLTSARAYFGERAELLAAFGIEVDVGRVVVPAWAGREAEARAEATAVTAYAIEQKQGWMLIFVEYALLVLDLGLGNYEAAFVRSTRDYQDDSFLVVVAFPGYIEAAVRCGQGTAAGAALEQLAARALTHPRPLTLGLLARSRALLTDDDTAEGLYREAIDRLRESRADLQLARAQLVYGEWLRRHNRRTDAREQLRTAHERFASVGAAAYAERARGELLATGERARKRGVDTTDDLTPQERQVALLASRGATNPEIATKLFVSPSTVDYHLRKVYRKLGVASRRQLGSALTQ